MKSNVPVPADFPTHALSIRLPWALFVVMGIKTLEIRTKKFHNGFKGKVFLHCGKQLDLKALRRLHTDEASNTITNYWKTMGGCIVGVVTVTKISDLVRREFDSLVKQHKNAPWPDHSQETCRALHLKDAAPIGMPVPAIGKLGFFRVPDEVRERIWRENHD